MGKIYLEGADNARDLGGLKTTDGAVSYTHLTAQMCSRDWKSYYGNGWLHEYLCSDSG